MNGISDREAGFTLPELLVAIALLALLATYTLGALQNISAARVIHERIGRAASIEAVRRHIRQTIQGARAVFVQRGRAQPASLAFLGEAGTLMLVGPSDPRLERGGLYTVVYRLKDKALVTTRTLYSPQVQDRIKPHAPIELLQGAQSIAFRYFGPVEEGARSAWHDRWLRTDMLPLQISVTVTLQGDGTRRWLPVTAVIQSAQ